jgi:hypothetical protein
VAALIAAFQDKKRRDEVAVVETADAAQIVVTVLEGGNVERLRQPDVWTLRVHFQCGPMETDLVGTGHWDQVGGLFAVTPKSDREDDSVVQGGAGGRQSGGCLGPGQSGAARYRPVIKMAHLNVPW